MCALTAAMIRLHLVYANQLCTTGQVLISNRVSCYVRQVVAGYTLGSVTHF